jgi:hypothetical protein
MLHPIKHQDNCYLRVSEPIEATGTWNEVRKPIEMKITGQEQLYEDSDKVNAYLGYALVKQKSKAFR